MAEENNKKIENKIVKEEVQKVEQGKETIKQAEKEIAKDIAKEVKVDKEKKDEDKKEKTVGSVSKGKKGSEQSSDKSKIAKREAIVNGKDLKFSTKHSIAICNYIKKKNIDKAIFMLEEVANYKKPVPMKGEIPHRKGKIMSGRYPINAVQGFIRLLRSLKSNAIANELELEKYVIACNASYVSRPYRRFGRRRFKRTHVTIKLIKPKQNKSLKTL